MKMRQSVWKILASSFNYIVLYQRVRRRQSLGPAAQAPAGAEHLAAIAPQPAAAPAPPESNYQAYDTPATRSRSENTPDPAARPGRAAYATVHPATANRLEQSSAPKSLVALA